MDNQWVWNEQQDTWMLGTEKNGAGVFLDNGVWYANVVHPYSLNVLGLGPFLFQDDACEAASAKLQELQQKGN